MNHSHAGNHPHDKDDQQGHNIQNGHHGHHTQMISDFKKRFWVSMVLTLPILALAPMIQDFLGLDISFSGDHITQFILSTTVFFYGGLPFLKGMVKEIKEKAPGMMTLIALAISVAYIYSAAVVFGLEGKRFFWELATLIDIMLLGHWIEMKSVLGASNALQKLAELMPSEATKIMDNGEQVKIPLSEIATGDLILVRPGEKIPADGIVKEGSSHVNESMLTGESMPVSKKKNAPVFGGSVNDSGAIKILVEHTGKDSFLSKVITLVKEAQNSKSKSQDLANKAASWLFYVALGAGLITFIAWLLAGRELEYAIERMVTVMIISCPHALGLAVPLVVAISTAVSAKNGLLIRNRTAFENSRKLTTIIFDKTGTLTKGEFGVTKIKSLNQAFLQQELLRLAASIESSSEHPIANGILKKAEEQGLSLSEVKNFNNLTGKGITGQIDQLQIAIVSPGYLQEINLQIPPETLNNNSETVVFVLIDMQLAGYISLSDEIRPESYGAVKKLQARGIKVIMATGDNKQVAQNVSQALELDGYYAEVLPEAKQALIQKLQAQGEFVAMTGDGVNDAPALAQADVGIAVGSGTDVASETADIILVNSNPKDISNLISFGMATYKKMTQNLIWASGYNIIAVPLAAGVLAPIGIILNPAVGAVLMSLSTVIVAVNAQLLKNQMSK